MTFYNFVTDKLLTPSYLIFVTSENLTYYHLMREKTIMYYFLYNKTILYFNFVHQNHFMF